MPRSPIKRSLYESLKTFASRRGGRAYDWAANVVRTRRKQSALARRQQIASANYADFRGLLVALFDLADAREYKELIALAESAAAGPHRGARGEFVRDLARFLMAARVSSHDEAATYADRLLASSSYADLQNSLPAASYDKLIVAISIALTRVGRYAEATALLDPAIDASAQNAALLSARAEIAWPHDADLAMSDVVRLSQAGQMGNADYLLYAFLEVTHPASPHAGKISRGSSPELPIVDALRARAKGDDAGYARAFNALFTEQGLSAPILPAQTFAYETLGGTAPASEGGPLVTVVMTAFNAEATLRYAANSILRQTHRNLELYIVDDVSTDGTREVMREIAAGDSRVHLLFNGTNTGTYVAKNRAMEVAAGAYITFHDSDDWAHPQRLERHVRAMEQSPAVMLSFSNLMRVSPEGSIEFTRWGKRFIHPSPASSFIRREVIERIGYFDGVRVSADTEYRMRARTALGQEALLHLRELLTVAEHGAASLTQSGSGKLNIEKYSQPRSQYAHAYWQWYLSTPPEKLYVAATGPRAFPAPAAILPDPRDAEADSGPAVSVATAASTPLVFGISLIAKQGSADWARTTLLLEHTLDSLLAQSHAEFNVIVCGHDRPELPQMTDKRIRFIASDARPPSDAHRFREDKMRKRRLIGSALREMGGGYFFPLDADDLVHRDVVRHVRETDNKRGYVILSGYALDYATQQLAPVPGVWSSDYNRVCGSSALIYFTPDELPVGGDSEPDLYFNLFQSHAYWPVLAEEYGRGLDPLPFAAGVYVLNHSQNLSFGLQRQGSRTGNIIAAVERHALPDGAGILREQFGWIA